jgi:hypothetical protein
MDLQARVQLLERRNRILIGLFAMLAIATPAVSLLPRLGAADDKSAATEIADRLVVRNANGTVAATLVATASGGNLSLCDALGKPRMVFAVGKDGPNIVLLDSQQSSATKGVRVALSASDKAGSSLSLFGDGATIPLASVRAKPASGSTPASGAFVAVNEENRPVAFPRSSKVGDDEHAGAGAKN